MRLSGDVLGAKRLMGGLGRCAWWVLIAIHDDGTCTWERCDE